MSFYHHRRRRRHLLCMSHMPPLMLLQKYRPALWKWINRSSRESSKKLGNPCCAPDLATEVFITSVIISQNLRVGQEAKLRLQNTAQHAKHRGDELFAWLYWSNEHRSNRAQNCNKTKIINNNTKNTKHASSYLVPTQHVLNFPPATIERFVLVFRTFLIKLIVLYYLAWQGPVCILQWKRVANCVRTNSNNLIQGGILCFRKLRSFS